MRFWYNVMRKSLLCFYLLYLVAHIFSAHFKTIKVIHFNCSKAEFVSDLIGFYLIYSSSSNKQNLNPDHS